MTRTANLNAINGAVFDPIDLAMLGAGWIQGGLPLTMEDAEYLSRVSVMLAVLHDDVCPDGFPGVFAYDIAEELGKQLAFDQQYDIAIAERIARGWIVAELERRA